MKVYENITTFIEKKIQYCFIVAAVFIVLEIANYGFLSIVAPMWVCTCVSIALAIMAVFYTAIIYKFIRNKYKYYLEYRECLLLKRVDLLETYINELNEKNIEVENKLAEAIQSKVEENAGKTISELTSAIEISSNAIENQMSSFEVNLNTHLSKDTESINTNVKEALIAQEKLAVSNAEALGNKIDGSTNSLSEAMHVCSIDTNNKVSDLADKVEEFRTEEKNNSDEVIRAITQRHGEQTKNIEKLSTQLEQKTGNIIDANVGTSNGITTVLNEIKNVMVSDREAIATKTDDNMIKLVRKLNEIAQKENVNAEKERALISGIDTKLYVLKEEGKQFTSDIVAEIIDKIEEKRTGNEKAMQEQKVSIESAFGQVSSRIDVVANATKENAEEQREKLNALREQIVAIIQYTDERTEALSTKTAKMQNELTKMLIQILNDTDDNAERANSSYDRIFNQVLGFSNSIRTSIEKLQQALELQKQSLEADRKETVATTDEQISQTQELIEKVNTYSKVVEKTQSESASRLENLQNQIINLNSLAEVLKNISATTRLESIYQETSAQVSPNVDPNRTEEAKDAESGVTVFNHYKENKLVSSDMVTGKKKTYDVEYDGMGRITKSRNYGSRGDVITELQFYPNGQVKTRTEKINVNGRLQTVISKFDEQGKKLK